MILIDIPSVTLTSPGFRPGHTGIDVIGSSLSTIGKLSKTGDLDYTIDFNGRPYFKVLHAIRRGDMLYMADDLVRKRKGHWSGRHFHIETIGANHISPACFIKSNRVADVPRELRPLIMPWAELTLPRTKSDIKILRLPTTAQFIVYLVKLMHWEGSFARDKNGIDRVYGYDIKEYKVRRDRNDYFTVSFMLRWYLEVAHLSPHSFAFLRSLDLAFQYGHITDNAKRHQESNYASRVEFFGKTFGGLRNDNNIKVY